MTENPYHALRIAALREANRRDLTPDEVVAHAEVFERYLAGPEATYPPPWDQAGEIREWLARELGALQRALQAGALAYRSIAVPPELAEHWIEVLKPAWLRESTSDG